MSPYRTPEPPESRPSGRTWRGRMLSLWRALLVLRGGRLRTRVVRQLVEVPCVVPCGVCAERREAALRNWRAPAWPVTASSSPVLRRAGRIGL